MVTAALLAVFWGGIVLVGAISGAAFLVGMRGA